MATRTSMAPRQPAAPEKFENRPEVAPAVDIYENDDEVLLVADLPGVEKDSLNIHFQKGELTIGGRRPEPQATPLLNEFRVADYRRSFVVPQGIDADAISAELNQGLLRVHLPKQASMKPKQIQVKGA